jgi:hypothetical protein
MVEEGPAQQCTDIVVRALEQSLISDNPDLVWVSILLGCVEAGLTRKQGAAWPTDLQVCCGDSYNLELYVTLNKLIFCDYIGSPFTGGCAQHITLLLPGGVP